eukprot:Skav201160  [mRNA]  locus=scaffold65:157971:174003:- [translate_table: standard]
MSKQFNASALPKSLGGESSYFHRAALDADKSGQLDHDELRSGLEKLGLRQDPNGLMASMDLDQDGQISYTEFLGATLNLDEERGERLMRYAFAMFDLDGDGVINMEELRDGGSLVSDLLPDGQTVDEVMEEVSSGDGVISFARFRSYMTHLKHGWGTQAEDLLTAGWPPSRETTARMERSPKAGLGSAEERQDANTQI